ncbi:hypothetical protein DHEL01_v210558 [Diaporthe helianthi]|uniref:Uncharacterized protein n=1 Tax=Diaporthe helianthi TaxID=158607 RepID=A0A2P5HLA6_DIAHE|nr:hypothetical protein DHEL01_v210558 [Diaporthe helianthi]
MLPPPHGRRCPTEETAEAFLEHFSVTAGYKIVRKRSAGKVKDGKIIACECHQLTSAASHVVGENQEN